MANGMLARALQSQNAFLYRICRAANAYCEQNPERMSGLTYPRGEGPRVVRKGTSLFKIVPWTNWGGLPRLMRELRRRGGWAAVGRAVLFSASRIQPDLQSDVHTWSMWLAKHVRGRPGMETTLTSEREITKGAYSCCSYSGLCVR